MIALTIADIATIVGGEIAPGVDATLVIDGSVQTDSRLVEAGSLFFALQGEETDGYLYAPAAVVRGAALVIAERPIELDAPVIVVSDGVAALADLARAVVTRVRSSGDLTVVAITGSNGKTTTKNMLGAILSRVGPTVAPNDSFNNHIGAPISMLRISFETRYLVVEMGASHCGEIAHLAGIALPDLAVVLKVGLAHVGEFGGVEATQAAKSELVTGLGEHAVVVLNADDERVASMAQLTRASVRWFGLGTLADIRATHVRGSATGTSFTAVTPEREMTVQLRIVGEHHVMNALAALTVARELGLDLADSVAALEGMHRAERWRMEVLPAPSGAVIINDAYNASPDSTAAALRTLVQLRPALGRSIAVLGEMTELGDASAEHHADIGRLAAALGVDELVVVGSAARSAHDAAAAVSEWTGHTAFVDTPDLAHDLLDAWLRDGDVVLVKSSKSAGLRFVGDRLAGVSA
ncbi:UDP-N-acetylmuramoyl-tripeptide--D-alanyl-D-alanine ligase [Glaciihabitans arcticus]|uniref:UDP-N-acetylmuramoyl-tripeptide--D-alanyl-D-alanine ligase n=1 Tax=Glaciihabitans arcticus TaxID=2668039 RepID=A0A4Q9GRI5_9MICO|nr:UDP-N-acetylmuramoyl-tripeptide--D-alanyl-D-alanine ligase [Glaciihabitans arcticus]TBN57556.1 UDP-N-acetylmuramoyl-tripeptide--D-alanyl-D-alanine ligase [Glaciihabitans arcticus]